MNIELRLPNLTAADANGQIRQLYGFLRQTVEQLNWAMGQLDGSGQGNVLPGQRPAAAAQKETAENTLEQFQNLKGLIIKSADIVNAYYVEFEKLLETSGKYVAQSEFGTFIQDTEQKISANANSVEQLVEDRQRIETDLQGVASMLKEHNGSIRYGEVGTTLDSTGLATENAMGIEIGDYQLFDDGSVKVTNQRYARFTAYGLELFGSDKEQPIAYLSGNRLYITNAEIKNSAKLGGYAIDMTDGLAFNWVGRS